MSRVVGVSMVKDEHDVIGPVVEHMLAECDYVIVADNMSSDGTREILKQLAHDHVTRLHVMDDLEQGYRQSRKMSTLAAVARQLFDADWVVPFDADEVWVARERGWGTIAQVLDGLPPSESIASAVLYDHVPTGQDPTNGDAFERIPWRRAEATPLPKVACRPLMPVTIEQGNHGANYGTRTPSPVLLVHHFPWRSAEQMIRKVRNGAAAYRAAPELGEEMGAHWRAYDQFDDDGIAGVFRKWFWRSSPGALSIEGEMQAAFVHDPVRASRPGVQLL